MLPFILLVILFLRLTAADNETADNQIAVPAVFTYKWVTPQLLGTRGQYHPLSLPLLDIKIRWDVNKSIDFNKEYERNNPGKVKLARERALYFDFDGDYALAALTPKLQPWYIPPVTQPIGVKDKSPICQYEDTTDDPMPLFSDCVRAMDPLFTIDSRFLSRVPVPAEGQLLHVEAVNGTCAFVVEYMQAPEVPWSLTDPAHTPWVWDSRCQGTRGDVWAHARIAMEKCAVYTSSFLGGSVPFKPDHCPGAITIMHTDKISSYGGPGQPRLTWQPPPAELVQKKLKRAAYRKALCVVLTPLSYVEAWPHALFFSYLCLSRTDNVRAGIGCWPEIQSRRQMHLPYCQPDKEEIFPRY